MLRCTLFIKHLAKATERNTRRLSHDRRRVLHAIFNKRPQLVHVRPNVFGATFNTDAKCHHCSLAMHSIWMSCIGLHQLQQRREDMTRRQLCRQ